MRKSLGRKRVFLRLKQPLTIHIRLGAARYRLQQSLVLSHPAQNSVPPRIATECYSGVLDDA